MEYRRIRSGGRREGNVANGSLAEGKRSRRVRRDVRLRVISRVYFASGRERRAIFSSGVEDSERAMIPCLRG
jgi:hypothetical protein